MMKIDPKLAAKVTKAVRAQQYQEPGELAIRALADGAGKRVADYARTKGIGRGANLNYDELHAIIDAVLGITR